MNCDPSPGSSPLGGEGGVRGEEGGKYAET